ncbi:hypothetical protein B9Z50_11270 [Limnohabitans sp. Bal53]|nr:hypothetical protein B9Z50_11270 [Limnohabitans sp. Bal53]
MHSEKKHGGLRQLRLLRQLAQKMGSAGKKQGGKHQVSQLSQLSRWFPLQKVKAQPPQRWFR